MLIMDGSAAQVLVLFYWNNVTQNNTYNHHLDCQHIQLKENLKYWKEAPDLHISDSDPFPMLTESALFNENKIWKMPKIIEIVSILNKLVINWTMYTISILSATLLL